MTARSASPYDKLAEEDNVDSDDEEKIRLYGSTRETAPLQGAKIRIPSVHKEDDEPGDIPLQHFQSFPAQQDPLLKKHERKSFRSEDLLPGAVSSQSLSTWSSETIVSTRSFSDSDSWLRHPKVRENWRVVLGSIVLTAIGVVLFIVGIAITASPQRGLHCIVFFIIGFLCFVPGLYHIIYIYFAVIGKPGYSFYDLPAFK